MHRDTEAENDIRNTVLSSVGETGTPIIGQYDITSCTRRFLGTALVGLSIDIIILALYDLAVLAGCHPGLMGLFYTLIEIPLISGILGIFFLNEMRDLAVDMIARFS